MRHDTVEMPARDQTKGTRNTSYATAGASPAHVPTAIIRASCPLLRRASMILSNPPGRCSQSQAVRLGCRWHRKAVVSELICGASMIELAAALDKVGEN